MPASSLHEDDIATLAAILDNERRSHERTRTLCFALFVFSFVVFAVGVGLAMLLVMGVNANVGGSATLMTILQVLSVLSGAVFGFFSLWWAAQNCVHSIERSLFAARAGRHQLFIGLVEQVKCSGKSKREILIELVKSTVT